MDKKQRKKLLAGLDFVLKSADLLGHAIEIKDEIIDHKIHDETGNLIFVLTEAEIITIKIIHN